MVALNGPTEGKIYHTSRITTKVIDHVRYGSNLFEVTYYRTKNGWAFHSWRLAFSLYIRNEKELRV